MQNKFIVIGYDPDDAEDWYATKDAAIAHAHKRLGDRYASKTQVIVQAIATVQSPVLMATVTDLV